MNLTYFGPNYMALQLIEIHTLQGVVYAELCDKQGREVGPWLKHFIGLDVSVLVSNLES